MCKQIQLSRGLVALVDDDDYDALICGSKWFASPHRHTFYAKRMAHTAEDRRTTEYMHRVLMPEVPRLDHRDSNGLNNQRSNLRAVTSSQNQVNRRLDSTNTSGYKGVSWHAASGKWHAILNWEGVRYSGRYWNDPVDAANAYDEMLRERAGDFGTYNFPRPGERRVYASTI